MKLIIPIKQNYNADYTAYWENFLTEEEINTILSLPEWMSLQSAKVGGQNGFNVIDERVRSTNITWVKQDEKTYSIWEKVAHAISEVNRRFFNFDLTETTDAPQLSLYSGENNRSDFYDWHIDMGLENPFLPRKLSMSLLLDDPSDFEGGELQVKATTDNALSLEQKKGRAWFFPSYTLHRVSPVTKGIRRSVVIWSGGPPFK